MKKQADKLPVKESGPEGITASILDYFKKCRPDIFAWKHWSGAFSKEGISDINGMIQREFPVWNGKGNILKGYEFENRTITLPLYIEVKIPSKKPSPAQQRFLDNVNDAGGLAFCAHSLEEVMEKLEG